MKKTVLFLAALCCVLVVQAGATVTVGQPWTGTLPMPAINYFGPGPQAFGNYTWTSTNATTQGGSVFGYVGGYGFGLNGYWDGQLGPMAGLNDSFDVYGVTDTMTFTFNTPVYAVGGFFNYVPGGTTPTTLAVWDVNNNLIESFDLTFNFNNFNLVNDGEWIRFNESTAIGYFTMTGNYVGVANPIPEPSTLLLLGTGALGIAGVIRRKLWP
jgi:hypothetical protein